MNKKNTYNQGVESGLKVAEKVIMQEVEAMDYIKSKIDLIVEGHDKMKSAVNQLLNDADENAIANIFGFCNEAKPVDLKKHEKIVLLNILATLSLKGLNERQQKYYNNIRHHLNIQGYEPIQNYDFRKIESLESVYSIKIIAKVVRIFLFLQDLNMDGIYCHNDTLFSHFELRSFDEIDAIIELIFYLFGEDGLIEMYGYFSESTTYDKGNLPYLNIPFLDNVEISFECAQIYFNDCYSYDENRQYIESSNYVIYSNGNNIIKLHKKTGMQDVLIENVRNAGEFIKKGKITTFSDIGYYVIENALYYIDLDTLHSSLIFEINEERNCEGEKYEVMRLHIYNSQKVIYENGSYYIVDLKEGIESAKKFSLGYETSNYFLRGDHIFFIDNDIDPHNFGKERYVLKKYGIKNEQTTNITMPFGEHDCLNIKDIDAVYKIIAEGMHDNYYYCIFGYKSYISTEILGLRCYYINTSSEFITEAKRFYISSPRISQISNYKNYLIYVNADKNYSIISHDFLKDNKRILLKNYGETEKSTLSERLDCGKSKFQHPRKFMRLGGWLWVKEKNERPKIISL